MELRPRGYDKIVRLMREGVDVPNPLTLDIADDVDLDRISRDGVTLSAGCRISGAKTVISAGTKLGAEAPVTVEDCWLGPKVELKGGYFRKSVFLEKASMALGAQVREGCLLEEEANGAHCVGLKQTILLPFATLGSLINFCDCLLAGGTSRKDHSEVGSSYIHFNFTPDGDKTTPSLFGDVPRGVMLDRPPIFLGGQGGAVGPLRVGYGTVVAAGSVLRRDVDGDGKLVVAEPHPGRERDFVAHAYRNLIRTMANNVLYLANLVALEQWYVHVRRPFLEAQELGDLVYAGALETLALAKDERRKRLTAMAEKAEAAGRTDEGLRERVHEACALFFEEPVTDGRDAFLASFADATGGATADYTKTIQGLPDDVKAKGTRWLQQVVDTLCAKTDTALGSMNLFAHEG